MSLIYKFKENMFASNRIVVTDVVMTVIVPVHELLIFFASVSSEGPGKSAHMHEEFVGFENACSRA